MLSRTSSQPLGGRPWLGVAARVLALVGVGVIAWLLLWAVTSPRAGYDTLWYEMFGLRYAGLSDRDQIAGSWEVFAQYGDPDRVAGVEEGGGWPWASRDDPSRARWIGIYQMRPVFPAIVAATYPLVGQGATIVPSIVAVVGFTLAVGLMAPALIGGAGTAIVLGLSIANPFFAGWLIHLTTDGLGLALWAATLLAAARWIAGGARAWVGLIFAVSLVAAFNRQTGIVISVALIGLAILACLARQRVWQRIAVAALATALPVAMFAVYGTVAGLPSVNDMLQDVPTRHFADPDRANIVRYVVAKIVEQTPVLVIRFLDPAILLPTLLGVTGLLVARSWWAGAILVSLVALPIVHYVHPVLTEANRAFAPGWFNIHVGLAILAVSIAPRSRRRSQPRWSSGRTGFGPGWLTAVGSG